MATFLDWFTPDEYVSSVYDIDLSKLWNNGKRLILTDLDNTLVPWNAPEAPQELTAWIKAAMDLGFDVCIVSNNGDERVETFAKRTGIVAVGAARKPRPAAFWRAMKMFDRSVPETVMVGDQLFTDIQGARRLGVYTILVLPINPQEWWGTRLVRLAERIVLLRLVRSGRVRRPHPRTQ